MFASVVTGDPGVEVDLRGWIDALAGLAPATDRERIEQVALLELLKSVAAAVQASITHGFTRSQLSLAETAGTDEVRARQSVAAQIALARRESPYRGRQHIGLAAALIADMPGTHAAMLTGKVPEWRATLVARQFGCLSAADRRRADAEIAPRLPELGDRGADGAALAIAARLDAQAVVGRIKAAVGERRVSVRPAPDGMSRVSALLPVVDGVGIYAALSAAADSATADAAGRSRGQLMADTLVARVTGRTVDGCDAYGVPNAGVELSLIMTDRALLDDDAEPALISGSGAVPAALARRLVASTDESSKVWVRRLYTDPATGALVAMESNRRLFPDAARRFLIARDQICRTPWCDAPIRHLDHITPVRDSGPTTLTNGQGLCQACNYTKEAPGWTSRAAGIMRKVRARQQVQRQKPARGLPGPTEDTSGPGVCAPAVQTTTPTGHRYVSTAPPLPPPTPGNPGTATSTAG